MAAIRPRDLLTETLLARLGGTRTDAAAPGSGDVAATLHRDIGKLSDAGYLNVALPPEFGGLGCTLRQAACGQRRLARRAPLTALAVSAHLYWTGAAADAYRAGDNSARWILLEAARGALFAGGHGTPGGDLRFADPRSRCEPAGESGYRFRDTNVLSSVTPAWDWVAVHAVHAADAVLAFAGRGSRCTPAFRVARVQPAGAPGDIFTTSAVGWGHAILASVEYSDARRLFNEAVAQVAASATWLAATADAAAAAPGGGHPLDQWAVAEAGLRLDAMKAKIAEITHPWPVVREPAPDLGGQHLISVFTMRNEVTEGARRVLSLTAQIANAPAVAAL
jgi:alkylation response protein AidB-like acyl-CoA dehydrogenase